MKKAVLALLALLLALTLIGCDAMVDMMGNMGKSVGGVDKKVLEDIKSSSKAEVTNVKEDDGKKSFSFSSGDKEKEMFSISSDGKTFTVGGLEITLQEGGAAAAELKNVESVLAPKDLTDTLIGLKSESTKAATEKHLKEEASEDDKKAAEGTQKVLAALVETLELPERQEITEDMTEEKKKSVEATNTALDTLEKILGKTEGEEKKVVTNADVVVLTALTNVLFDESTEVLETVKDLQNDEKTEEEKNKLQDDLVKSISSEASTMLDVVSVVPSEMASGILDVISILKK